MKKDIEAEGLAAMRRPGIDSGAPHPTEWDADAALAKVREREPSADALEAIERAGGSARSTHAGLARYKIFALGALAAALVVTVVEAWRLNSGVAVIRSGTAVATLPAERARLRLEDGTEVVLAPRSRLQLAPDFGGGSREITIDGEAYLHVATDRAKAFRISTKGSIIEVLGTTFAVRAYAGDSVTQVAVVEGRVSFGAAADPSVQRVVLTGGDVARLGPAGGVVVTKVPDLQPYTDWVNGRITFRDTPLQEAVTRLGHWYGVTIQIRDTALAHRRVDASFGASRVDDLLAALASAVGARAVQQQGDTWVLVPIAVP